METSDKLRARLMAMQIIVAAPIVVMVIFAAIVAYLVKSGNVDITDTGLHDLFQYLVPALMIAGLAGAHFYFKAAIGSVQGDTPLHDKISKYQVACLVRTALLEVPGLFGAIAALLTGDLYFLGAPIMLAFVFLLIRPTSKAMTIDLNLKTTDRDAVEKALTGGKVG